MGETEIVDIWTVFKEYLDKKTTETAAERYVDLLADYGVEDNTFMLALGSDGALDAAIHYYLDMDAEDVLDEEVDWD
jgi:hypothetical protein